MTATRTPVRDLALQVDLEKMRVGCQHVIDNAELIENDWLRGEVVEGLVYQLRSYVLAEKLVGDTYTVDVATPSNVWQMVKERHAPAWFVRRFPVRYDQQKIIVRFERYATYPNARLSLEPTLGKAVLFERATNWSAT